MPKTTEEWLQISKDFENIWQFPHTLGALDGKHVRIIMPPNEGSTFYNYKGFHSIVLLALVDAHGKFTYIDVGSNGRASDGGIFEECNLKQLLDQKKLNIPEPIRLTGQLEKTPYFIISDDAFPLSNYLMKPYSRIGNLSKEQEIFNYRLLQYLFKYYIHLLSINNLISDYVGQE